MIEDDKYSLTLTERAILINQYKVLSLLDKSNVEEYEVLIEALDMGYTGSYHLIFPGNMKEIPHEVCSETHEILTMYRAINNGIEKLKPDEKKKLDLIKFEGFDANEGEHYAFASFLVEKEKKYSEYNGKMPNSHSSASLEKYRRIFEVFDDFRKKGKYDLSFADLQELNNAAKPNF